MEMKSEAREQFINRHFLDPVLGHHARFDSRVAGDDVHLEAGDFLCDQTCDPAEAKQAERLAGQVPVWPGGVTVPNAAPDEPILSRDLPDHREHETDRVLGDLVHGHLGGVGNHDAQARRFRHRDIVGARAGAQDHSATVQEREHIGRDHPRAAHRPHNVGVAGGFHDLGSARAFTLHQLDPLLCELWVYPVGRGRKVVGDQGDFQACHQPALPNSRFCFTAESLNRWVTSTPSQHREASAKAPAKMVKTRSARRRSKR